MINEKHQILKIYVRVRNNFPTFQLHTFFDIVVVF